MTEEQATAVINALFESHYAPLVRYACRFTGSLPDAEDIVQDAFTQLYRQLREGKSVDNPAGWAVCVVRRQALSGRRENLEQTVPPGMLDRTASEWREPMEADTPAVNELLSALSPREQEVIFLRLSEMKYRDIAKELGISSSSVNTLLARAVRKLQVAASKATGLKRWKKARQDEFPQTLQ